ncbi:unnamed protein product [Sphenostylis stenocarpa]|uniref:Uncharacterized protein n=1 Tax=Sphenostylis stenocarpa TaxID=92480 RepID=A0AA86T6J7_9FABA|nr:unnamed protein product [Sphenostylis stenocarpa]
MKETRKKENVGKPLWQAGSRPVRWFKGGSGEGNWGRALWLTKIGGGGEIGRGRKLSRIRAHGPRCVVVGAEDERVDRGSVGWR